MNYKETNNFRTFCQCCGRTVKGNESKYAIQFQKYPLKEEFGYYVHGKKYSLCKSCLRSIELFIKKGGGKINVAHKRRTKNETIFAT